MAVNEWKYDVFISFRGADTRWNFTENLYRALAKGGIRTFMDGEGLQKRGQTTTAIEQSRISIVVFSKRYAFSSFCLDELARIWECFNKNDQLVFPVFYDVDPSDVLHQRGSYKEAFDKHEERFKDNKEMLQRIQIWRTALHQVANLPGFTFKQGDEYEYQLIGRIIKHVSSKINLTPLPVTEKANPRIFMAGHYDVFLSFRGPDTRYGFTGHLYSAITQRGIRTFMDDEELRRGEQMAPALLKAIEQSKIAVVVFSKNYASSSFCLEELAKICKSGFDEKSRLVIPVFYDIDPSDVRHQRGYYEESFARHEKRFKDNKEKVQRWRMALHQAADLSGFTFKQGCGYEHEYIGRIIKKVSSKINHASLPVANYPVGLESQVLKVNSLLDVGSDGVVGTVRIYGMGGLGKTTLASPVFNSISSCFEEVFSKINCAPLPVANYPVGLEARVLKVNSLLDPGSDDVVRMVGICGMGGLGKTTLARVLFNSSSIHFEGLCFLEHVRVNSDKYGMVYLQETLLSQIGRDLDIKLGNVLNGISIIKRRLHQKKVLLVLDDVDRIQQLQALAGATDWFGSGSRVIITTRDRSLLEIHGIERTYELEELNEKEALQLLSHNAFKTDKVDPSYVDIVNRAVSYASGLPLALEVIGSNFYGKRREDCELALERFKRILPEPILEILKVSFDSLDEDEKAIFLDIACFFRGHKLADVEDILCAHHGLEDIKYIINMLIEKYLLKVDDGLVKMHELIQHMGREIVRQESPEEPGERSRLWYFEDILQVLEGDTGTSTIEIITLDFPKHGVHSKGPKSEEVKWDGMAIKKMKNLRTLIISNVRFSKGPTHLPDSLRVLTWRGYPSPSLPHDFRPKKLRILELPDSCLKPSELIQRFSRLIVLDFGYSECITHIPDLSGAPNLEKLSFEHCKNLSKIHESVGYLDKLRILDAVGCKKLKSFPPIRLMSLQQLYLSCCSILESFPKILGKMENITELHITSSPIKELPSSISNLTRLRELELQLCGKVRLPSGILKLSELGLLHVSRCEGLLLSEHDSGEEMPSKSSNMECVILSCCNISDELLPICLTWFNNVKDLNLSGNSFTILPECIKECHFLRNIKLDDCRLLTEIRGIPYKLEIFSAKGCISLKALDLRVLPAGAEEFHYMRDLYLDDCEYLTEIRGVRRNLDNFSAKNCTHLTSLSTSMLLNQESIEAGYKMFCLPGTKIPEWFTHCTWGESISFWFRNQLPALSLCLVIGPMDEQPITVKFSPSVLINHNKQSLDSWKVFEFRIETDHIFLFDLQMLKFDVNVNIFSEKEWNLVEVSYADHITNGEVPIKLVVKQSGIHVIRQTCSMEDIQFTNPNYKNSKTDDVELLLSEHESEEYSYNADGSDSDDSLDWVNTKLPFSREQTTSSGESSGDVSLTSLRDAINALGLLTVNGLYEISPDHAMQSQLDHLLDLLSTINHPKVIIEVKEALVEFKRKAPASCEEFQATIEPVNELKNFEKQRDRILQEAREGKDRWKDIKNSIKKASLSIKAENSRKKVLEAEIATLRKQLAMKESDLEQLVLNVTNQEATLSTYLRTCASLDEQARELLKEVDHLVTKNIGVE